MAHRWATARGSVRRRYSGHHLHPWTPRSPSPHVSRRSLDTLDEQEDDLYIGLVPEICGHLGASVLDPLERFLADPEHAQFPRMTVTDALEAIAIAEPQTCARVVAVLVAALARHEELPSLNGGLVAGLVALRAVDEQARKRQKDARKKSRRK